MPNTGAVGEIVDSAVLGTYYDLLLLLITNGSVRLVGVTKNAI